MYPKFGPSGHSLDLVIYMAMGFAGPGLAIVASKWSFWLLVPALVVVCVTVVVRWNERRAVSWLAAQRSTDASSTVRAGFSRGSEVATFRQRTAEVGLRTDVTDVADAQEMLDDE